MILSASGYLRLIREESTRVITSAVTTATELSICLSTARERKTRGRKYLVKRANVIPALNEIKSLTKPDVRMFAPRKTTRNPPRQLASLSLSLLPLYPSLFLRPFAPSLTPSVFPGTPGEF